MVLTEDITHIASRSETDEGSQERGRDRTSCFITAAAKDIALIGSTKEIDDGFRLFDVNGDGLISFEELRTVLETVGQCSTDARLRDIFSYLDSDGSGSIDLEEFRRMALEATTADSRLPEADIHRAFLALDMNQDGLISIEELMMALLRLSGLNASVEEAADMISQADRNGDGFISYPEFLHIMRDGEWQNGHQIPKF